MHRFKQVALLLSLLLLLGLAVGCGGGSQTTGGSDEDVVKVGFLGALTGDVACYGIPGLKGLELAVEEINANGGILGKKVVIVKEDNAGDKTEAASIVKKFISKDKVNAIIGDPCTGITIVAARIAQDHEMVLISPGACGEGAIDAGDYCFRNTLLDKMACPAVTKYLIDKGYKNFALVTAINDEYSVGLSNYFRAALKEYGGNIVIEESIQRGDTNFAAQVTKIKPTNPDIIIFTGYYQEAALFMKEVRKQGMDQIFVAGDGCLGEELYKLGGDAVEGGIVYCGFSPEQNRPEVKEFLDAYAKKYNGELADMFAAQYYDAMYIVAQAMERAGSTDPKVYKAEMANTKDFPGVSGITTFGPDREPIKNPVFLLQVKDNSFKLLDTAEVI
ncbi:MAG: ABC transporter substrate-binding protein [Syntrophomonadaceae bacterium]|nr:ABC transporter substrate-binding protein [Syntrophomonadaceae bacterium]